MPHKRPIAVDMDGTLLIDETHQILLKKFLCAQPTHFLKLIPELFSRGFLGIKWQCLPKNLHNLPQLTYRKHLITWLKRKKETGHTLLLITGAPSPLANHVASPLKLFDHIIGSCRSVDCVGQRKAKILTKKYGEKGFDYIGNSIKDIAVWKKAYTSYSVPQPALYYQLIQTFLSKPLKIL